MDRVNWNKYEEALLIEAYIEISMISDQDQYLKAWKEKAESLSLLLRNYAESKGLSINDKYRNTTGINMKMQNIKYLYTDEKEGLSNFSRLDSDMVCMEKVSKANFNTILSDAKKLIYKKSK